MRPPPEVTKCLTDYQSKGMHCINSKGTEFFLKFDSPSADKHVCMPGKQFIDATAWIQELLTVVTKGKK